MEIFKDFTFEAAHYLPNLPDDHKCRRLHGHSYHVRIYVKDNLQSHTNWVMDFADIKKIFNPILDQLDHRYLNEVPGLENPTCEQVAIWIWKKLKPELNTLSKVEIKETCTSGCVYYE